jgi:hypothetical protein
MSVEQALGDKGRSKEDRSSISWRRRKLAKLGA